MSWDIFIQSMNVAKENRITALNFFGGEPLLNPQVFSMLESALESGFSVMLATNCRPLSQNTLFTRFLRVTKRYKKDVHIFTARDKFHLQHFDPAEIIGKLRMANYAVVVSNYSNDTILLSEYNVHNQNLQELDTHFSCCNGSWTDYVGVLPNGGWTICPPSLESFGNVFSNSLEEIVEFKRRLPLRFKEGCTECLKDFKMFRKEFEISHPNQNKLTK
jgi:MoaA/NifB/PqqE/SkfB family radical SAM enzyme